jgi:hypothetical protein
MDNFKEESLLVSLFIFLEALGRFGVIGEKGHHFFHGNLSVEDQEGVGERLIQVLDSFFYDGDLLFCIEMKNEIFFIFTDLYLTIHSSLKSIDLFLNVFLKDRCFYPCAELKNNAMLPFINPLFPMNNVYSLHCFILLCIPCFIMQRNHRMLCSIQHIFEDISWVRTALLKPTVVSV